jgi:hypothetical protein
VNELGELWLCDRTFINPGLRVFNTATDAAIAGPISTGVPPADVEFEGRQRDRRHPTPSRRRSMSVLAAGPNPTRGEWSVRFAVGESASEPARLRRLRRARRPGRTALDLGPGRSRRACSHLARAARARQRLVLLTASSAAAKRAAGV